MNPIFPIVTFDADLRDGTHQQVVHEFDQDAINNVLQSNGSRTRLDLAGAVIKDWTPPMLKARTNRGARVMVIFREYDNRLLLRAVLVIHDKWARSTYGLNGQAGINCHELVWFAEQDQPVIGRHLSVRTGIAA